MILLDRDRKHSALLRALREADRGMSGYELARAARVSSAFAYIDLTRLMNDGIVRDWWGPPEGRKQLRRRFYELVDRSAT